MGLHRDTPADRIARLETGIARIERRLTPDQRSTLRRIEGAGVDVPSRRIINFPAATVEDDPVGGRTNVTLGCRFWRDEFTGTGPIDESTPLWYPAVSDGDTEDGFLVVYGAQSVQGGIPADPDTSAPWSVDRVRIEMDFTPDFSMDVGCIISVGMGTVAFAVVVEYDLGTDSTSIEVLEQSGPTSITAVNPGWTYTRLTVALWINPDDDVLYTAVWPDGDTASAETTVVTLSDYETPSTPVVPLVCAISQAFVGMTAGSGATRAGRSNWVRLSSCLGTMPV